jgi:hypothetical protein
VKAYEKYNELMGAGRQLTLRLADNVPEAPAGPVAAAPPDAGVERAPQGPSA